MTQTQILDALKTFKLKKSTQYGIQALGVFGSMARGDSKATSDVDVVVQLNKQDLFNMIGIKQDLQELLHLPVDLVSYRVGMDAFLRERIDRDAMYV
ncbi:MAG: nucleotidyltransferase domain-containing protein [Phycisphaeraceae bacterium]|nr:nucleotidyltransferase domain-containing protein [Phycisphaeraceae bacterium]